MILYNEHSVLYKEQLKIKGDFNRVNIKTKVISGLASIALGTSLVASGTFALFNSQSSNSGNTIATGSVKIAPSATPIFVSTELAFSNLKPGDSGQKTIVVENTGSLDAWVRMKGFTGEGDLFSGDHFLTLSNNEVFDIPSGKSRSFTVTYNFPLQAGDSYQGKSGKASINFEGVQVKNNLYQPDQWGLNSFGISPQKSNFTLLYVNKTNIPWKWLSVTLKDNNNFPIPIVPSSAFKWFLTHNNTPVDNTSFLQNKNNFTFSYINNTYLWTYKGLGKFIGNPNPSWMNIGNVDVNANPPFNYLP